MLDVAYQPPGYDDALDVNTSLAVEYLAKHRDAPKLSVAAMLPPLSREAIRTLLVVDAACDVPKAWLDFNAVAVMPRTVRFRNEEFLDIPGSDRANVLADKIHRDADRAAISVPHSPLAMRDHMQRFMLSGTEAVLHVCSSARRSKHFVNALSATQSLVLIHNKVRRTLGQQSSVTAWVIDSMNVLGGVGVMVAHAVKLRERGMMAANIAVTLNSFRSNVHTLIVPNDLAIAANGARTLEQQSIPSWKLTVAGALGLKPVLHVNNDRLRRLRSVRGHTAASEGVFSQIESLVTRGALSTPFVAVSYAGRLDTVERMPAYHALRGACNRHQVTLSLAPMSMTGILALGPNAVAVSFASQQFRA